jgi:hypothetical protein
MGPDDVVFDIKFCGVCKSTNTRTFFFSSGAANHNPLMTWRVRDIPWVFPSRVASHARNTLSAYASLAHACALLA